MKHDFRWSLFLFTKTLPFSMTCSRWFLCGKHVLYTIIITKTYYWKKYIEKSNLVKKHEWFYDIYRNSSSVVYKSRRSRLNFLILMIYFHYIYSRFLFITIHLRVYSFWLNFNSKPNKFPEKPTAQNEIPRSLQALSLTRIERENFLVFSKITKPNL